MVVSDMNPVAKHFDRVSSNYARYFVNRKTGIHFCLQRRLELSRELAAGTSGRLLDCACGTGEITCALITGGQFDAATLNDISAAMQEKARALLAAEAPSVSSRFVQSDIFEFAPGDEKFDFIMCLGLIAHTGRLEQLLDRLKWLLAPGGRILLQTTLANHPHTVVLRMLTSSYYRKRFGYQLAYYTHADIVDACARNGLRIARSRRYQVGFPLLHQLWAWGSFQVESRLQRWASRYGTEAIYLIERDGQ
ncbi:MAG: class I SAM-dependent methyltransferase [Rhodomicrobium sp.]